MGASTKSSRSWQTKPCPLDISLLLTQTEALLRVCRKAVQTALNRAFINVCAARVSAAQFESSIFHRCDSPEFFERSAHTACRRKKCFRCNFRNRHLGA